MPNVVEIDHFPARARQGADHHLVGSPEASLTTELAYCLCARVYDPDFKTAAYLQAGVREVWRVDLRDHTVFVSRQGGPVDEPHAGRLIWHPAEMPQPLELDLRSVFR